jgi:hypothetical protein
MKSKLTTLSLIISLFFITDKAQCQKGYVKTMEDSIFSGDIRFATGEPGRGLMIKIYQDIKQDPKIFYSKELKEYAAKNDTFALVDNIEVITPKNSVIEIPLLSRQELQILSRGKLTLYKGFFTYSPKNGGGNFYTTGGNGKVNKEKYFLIEDKKGYKCQITKENLKKNLQNLMSDCPQLIEKIENSELGYKDLEEIVDQYNYFKR